jgi:arylformamidase
MNYKNQQSHMAKTYRNMSPEQLEREYSPSSAIGGDYHPYIEQYIAQSQNARESLPAQLDLRYGNGSAQLLDLFHPGSMTCPVHIFIHGGYWQELSHRESSPMAPFLLEQGIAFATLNYTLAPQASIDDMVAECQQAIQWLITHADQLNIDPANLTISGHSAGAQLAAMSLIRWQQQDSDIVRRIQKVLLISGLYDLTPIPLTSINSAPGLDHQTALRLSPSQYSIKLTTPIKILVAEQDTNEFKRQAREYYQHLKLIGSEVEFFEIPDKNHFDIILAPIFDY